MKHTCSHGSTKAHVLLVLVFTVNSGGKLHDCFKDFLKASAAFLPAERADSHFDFPAADFAFKSLQINFPAPCFHYVFRERWDCII